MTGGEERSLPQVGLIGSVPDLFPGVPSRRFGTGDLAGIAACDLVVVAGADAHRGELVRKAGQGAPVVVLDRKETDVADLALSTTPDGSDRWLPPAIDPSVANPVGWRRQPTLPVAVLPTSLGPGLKDWLGGEGLEARVLLSPAVASLRRGLRRAGATAVVQCRDEADLVDRLRRFSVVVHRPDWHADSFHAARNLLLAAAAGTPIVAAEDPVVRELGLPVAQAGDRELMAAARGFVQDHDERERASVRARRSALWQHSGRARLGEVVDLLGLPAPRPPLVSVLLASNRPDMVAHGIRSVAEQRYRAVELVLILHGDGFSETPTVDRLDRPVRVVRVPAERVLGEALNAGLEVATGELVTKMDDDDFYGRDHLLDLVLAMEYSGADVVGKRIDHVYLRDQDVTLVRRRSNPERDRRHVGGPTLMLRTRVLRDRGFPTTPARVDTLLQDALREEGMRVYGTHSLDVVLHRHGANTWSPDIERMLAEAEHVAPGLDLSRAATEPGAFAVELS